MSQDTYPPPAAQGFVVDEENPLHAFSGTTVSQILTKNQELKVNDKYLIDAVIGVSKQLEDVKDLLTLLLEKL